MSKKRKYTITLEDRQNAKRLRKIWDAKKADLNLTQVKAAKLCKIAQPTFSQYLNCTMPLNTDMVLKMAAILQVSPADIAPSLKNVSPLFNIVSREAVTKQIPILGAMSGRKTMQTLEVTLDAKYSETPYIAGYLIDNEQFAATMGYPPNSVILVDMLKPEIEAKRLCLLQLSSQPEPCLANVEKLTGEDVVFTDMAVNHQRRVHLSEVVASYQVCGVTMG